MECDCDFASVHSFLVRIPKDLGVPIENIINIADSLIKKTPPDALKDLCQPKLFVLIEQGR